MRYNNKITAIYLIKPDDHKMIDFLFKKACKDMKDHIDYNLPQYEAEVLPPNHCGSEPKYIL